MVLEKKLFRTCLTCVLLLVLSILVSPWTVTARDIISRRVELGDGVILELIYVKGGTYEMGSPEDEPGRSPGEGPVHPVTVGSFWIGRFEVTQDQWRIIMGRRPWRWSGPKFPVRQVEIPGVEKFCRRLSRETGLTFRLPTEAEWEYACRAGSQEMFCYGNDPDGERTKYYAWFEKNSGEDINPVGTRVPNSWGIHDMLGNVSEFCLDDWHESYDGAPSDGSAWRGKRQQLHVARGGCFISSALGCRSTYRGYFDRKSSGGNYGFRVVCEE